MAMAVSKTVIICISTAIIPGIRKLAERMSGLKRTLGRASTGSVRLVTETLSARSSDSLSAMALATFIASPATEDSEPSIRISALAVSPANSLRE